jgi:hypothetical protein
MVMGVRYLKFNIEVHFLKFRFISIYRNIEPKYRNIEMSDYRNIELNTESKYRIQYRNTEPKYRTQYQTLDF